MTRIFCLALNPTIDISAQARRVQAMRKTRTTNQNHHPGGGGINVARVLVELGGAAELVYLAGGPTGVLLQEFLEQTSIGLHRFNMSQAVRVAFMVREQETGFEYRFVPDGPEVSAIELEPVFGFLDQIRADYVIGSGSLPRGAAPDTYARMARIVAKNGGRFVLDTSGEPLRHALDGGDVYLLKPSLGELESYVGEKLDEDGTRRAAMDIVSRGGAEHVALTLGVKGALLAGPEGVTRMAARHVATRSAVGAGDSFVAGLVWGLSRGAEPVAAFRYAGAAGAAAAMTSGTELCRRKDVHKLYLADCADQNLTPNSELML